MIGMHRRFNSMILYRIVAGAGAGAIVCRSSIVEDDGDPLSSSYIVLCHHLASLFVAWSWSWSDVIWLVSFLFLFCFRFRFLSGGRQGHVMSCHVMSTARRLRIFVSAARFIFIPSGGLAR